MTTTADPSTTADTATADTVAAAETAASPPADAAPPSSPPQSTESPEPPPRNADASATLPGASAMAVNQNDPIRWWIEPHLIDDAIICSGTLNFGARISDVMNGESAAFTIYRHRPELPPEQRYYPVIVIVPRRSDGRAWPAQMASGAQVIAADQYVVSGRDFMFYADIGGLLSDDEEQHILAVTGAVPGADRSALGRRDIHRYYHSRLPRRSLWSALRRRLLCWLRAGLAWLKSTWQLLLKLAVIAVCIVIVAFAIIGFIVTMNPELLGLEIVDQAQWILRWLPWHR